MLFIARWWQILFIDVRLTFSFLAKAERLAHVVFVHRWMRSRSAAGLLCFQLACLRIHNLAAYSLVLELARGIHLTAHLQASDTQLIALGYRHDFLRSLSRVSHRYGIPMPATERIISACLLKGNVIEWFELLITLVSNQVIVRIVACNDHAHILLWCWRWHVLFARRKGLLILDHLGDALTLERKARDVNGSVGVLCTSCHIFLRWRTHRGALVIANWSMVRLIINRPLRKHHTVLSFDFSLVSKQRVSCNVDRMRLLELSLDSSLNCVLLHVGGVRCCKHRALCRIGQILIFHSTFLRWRIFWCRYGLDKIKTFIGK